MFNKRVHLLVKRILILLNSWFPPVYVYACTEYNVLLTQQLLHKFRSYEEESYFTLNCSFDGLVVIYFPCCCILLFFMYVNKKKSNFACEFLHVPHCNIGAQKLTVVTGL